MLYKIRFRPTFANLFVTLNPNESILAEVGSLVSMESGIIVKTKLAGGLIASIIGRILGQKLFFVQIYTNKSNEAKSLILSPTLLGDIERIDLSRGGICVRPEAYLAHTAKVRLKVRWTGLRRWLRGEDLFKLQFKGEGRVFIGSYGGITKRTIYQDFLVDLGHLLAYEPSIRLKKQAVVKGFNRSNSSEPFVGRLKGKGIVYLQSRSFAQLVQYLRNKD